MFHWTTNAGRVRLLALLGLIVHAVHGLTGFGGGTVDTIVVQGVYDALGALAVTVCAALAWRSTDERLAWTLIAAALACTLAGDVGWSVGLGDPSGRPTVCDVAYLAFYPLALAGCARLAQPHIQQHRTASWLDALGAVLAVGALGSAFALRQAFAGGNAEGSAAITTFGYPALDLMLVAVIVGIAAAQGWRLDRRWVVLGAGILLGGVADGIYFVQTAAGTYIEGGILDSLWPASLLLIAQAATVRGGRRVLPRTPTLALPLALAASAIVVLVVDHFTRVPLVAVIFACGALVAVLARSLLAFRENEVLLAHTRVEALTDGLTGLPNRRALMLRLDELLEARTPSTLVLFDLDGFKLYNDTFGHPAGDALLIRLAGRLLEAVVGDGSAYRMGGDEFCVLLAGEDASSARVELALRERGERFDVSASFGAVALPREAADATAAFRIADQRLYLGKGRRRGSAGAQAGDALFRVSEERRPALSEHLDQVARVATAVAVQLGLSGGDVTEVRRAAQLHDIGKVALPDLILQKTTALTDEERSFVEQHTVIGERILLAAPALHGVARIVRACHERWDGAGYPDGLAGTDIAIGARIVAVSDAYVRLMGLDTAGRAAALAELAGDAGTRFDPAVVSALAALPISPIAPAGPRRPPSARPVRECR